MAAFDLAAHAMRNTPQGKAIMALAPNSKCVRDRRLTAHELNKKAYRERMQRTVEAKRAQTQAKRQRYADELGLVLTGHARRDGQMIRKHMQGLSVTRQREVHKLCDPDHDLAITAELQRQKAGSKHRRPLPNPLPTAEAPNGTHNPNHTTATPMPAEPDRQMPVG